MIEPWTHNIENKWPAARAVGPNVDPKLAMEFIRRTDGAIAQPDYACNDRRFCAELQQLLLLPDDPFDAEYEKRQRFLEEFGHVSLEHLSSRWVATSYMGGPHGLVSPVGEVRLAENFGKWPSVKEIEGDISAIAREFPWLEFDLWLWDSPDEADAVRWGSDPTHAWAVSGGEWRRAPVEGACSGKVVPAPSDVTADVLAIALGTRRETTFSIARIKEMWGKQISEAWERVNAMEDTANDR